MIIPLCWGLRGLGWGLLGLLHVETGLNWSECGSGELGR